MMVFLILAFIVIFTPPTLFWQISFKITIIKIFNKNVYQVEVRGSLSAGSSTRPRPPSPWTAAGAGRGGFPGGPATDLREISQCLVENAYQRFHNQESMLGF